MVAFIYDLLIILAAGLASGIVAKRFGFSMLVGYLLAGAVVGQGCLGLVAEETQEIEHLAHAGVLLLLFAIGIEFSLSEFVHLSRYFFLGGSLQMILVAVPVTLFCTLMEIAWGPAVLIGSAVALSSTVVVFRALTEWGETASPSGRRAIGILLFQDAALVPLLLLLPLLIGGGEGPSVAAWAVLAVNSVMFVAAVLVLRLVFAHWIVPLLGELRSVELVVLFGLLVLVGFCLGAVAAGLPPAMGALAAGLALNGNRLTGQVDALILPYRESFGAVFFVSLGTLLDPGVLMDAPVFLLLALGAVLVVKASAATIALRVTGLSWSKAAGMGLGLAQLGELSFILLSQGVHMQLISTVDYNRMLFVAIGSLILTPMLLKRGIRFVRRQAEADAEAATSRPSQAPPPKAALVIGLGPIGRRVTSQLEIMGIDVCLIDMSPVNLYPYAQQGFRTISGDAREVPVLQRAGAAESRLAIVSVPEDRAAWLIVRTLNTLSPECKIVVRCRYQANVASLKKAGAASVVSEEAAVSAGLLKWLETLDSE